MTKLAIASKILGGAVAAAVVYDAHKIGVRGSAEHVKIRQASRIRDTFLPSTRSESRSDLTSNLKDKYARFHLEWNLPDKFNAVVGYVKHSFNQLAEHIIPATLATGALLSKNYSKFFGAGLLVYGLKYLVCDVMDIGRPNYLKTYNK